MAQSIRHIVVLILEHRVSDQVLGGPALSGLAQEYARCDRWFASVPGPTWPNRLFVHAATSRGVVTNDARVIAGVRTIFENLSDAGLTWKIYSHDFPHAQLFGRLTQPEFADNWDSIGGFKRDAAGGALPHYAFIEPQYTRLVGPAASDPAEAVGTGDEVIDEVYHAVRTSPAWNDSMLVVTWADDGGADDQHVPPDSAVPPDDSATLFAFDRLGVRVPSVIVSPWIPHRTIVTGLAFEHASIPATIKKVFGLPAFLTRRDRAASTFETVASLGAPRTDTPLRFRAPSRRNLNDWGDEIVAPHEARTLLAAGEASVAPISELQRSLVELARSLSADLDQPEIAALDLLRPMTTEHDAAVSLRQAAARIRASLRQKKTAAVNARAAHRSKLHVTQDDHGFWQLSLEHPDGTLTLLGWQSVAPTHLVDEAFELVRSGRCADAAVVIDPPRRRTPAAAVEWPKEYSRPAPRRAGE